jgi:magnesium transporter
MTTERVIGDRITWVNITDPTLHDVAWLRRNYPFIHPLNLEDVSSYIERPKLDDQPDYLFAVMHFPLWDAATRLSRPSEVDCFVGRDFIVTIHDGVLKPLNRLFRDCNENETERKNLLGKSAGHAFYVILDQLVDYIFPILSKVEASIRALEERIFDEESGADIIRAIALVRRDTIALRRIIRQQIPIFEQLERSKTTLIHEELDEYFGDLVDHIQRARDIIDEDAEVIIGISDTADTLISHRLNNVIRILTVFSVIMLPLTFISSVFGMNVDFPINEQHPDSFLFISAVMIIIAAVMLIYFRRRKWL